MNPTNLTKAEALKFEQTGAVIVHCTNAHNWIVLRLPAEVLIAVRAMKRATCPTCGSIKVYCGAVERGWTLPPTPKGKP